MLYKYFPFLLRKEPIRNGIIIYSEYHTVTVLTIDGQLVIDVRDARFDIVYGTDCGIDFFRIGGYDLCVVTKYIAPLELQGYCRRRNNLFSSMLHGPFEFGSRRYMHNDGAIR